MNLSISFVYKTFVIIFSLSFSSILCLGQIKTDSIINYPEKQIQKIKNDSLLNLKTNISNILKINKKAISNLGLEIQHQSIYQEREKDSLGWQGLANIGVKFQTFGLPIQFNLASKTLPKFGYDFNRQQLFNFKYIDQLNNLKSNSLVIQALKTQINSQLSDIKIKAQKGIEDLVKDHISKLSPIGLEPALIKSLVSLREVELEDQLNSILEKKKNNITDQLPWDDQLQPKKDSLENDIKKYKETLLNKIVQFKNQLNKLGIKDMRQLIAFTDDKIDADKMLESLIKDKLGDFSQANLKSKFGQKLNGFSLGQFSYQMPFNLLNKAQFFSGFQTTLKTNKGPVTLGLIKDNNLIGLNETEFNQNVFSTNRYTGFMKAVVKNGSNSKGTLSFAGTSSAYNNNGSNRNNSSPNQTSYTLGFEQFIKFRKVGNLRIDFNKSLSRFNDAILTDFKGQFISQNFNQAFDNSFSQSFSGSLTHQMELQELGVNSQVYFNYSGNQFQNPGNSAINQPRIRWGGKIKKSLLDSKIILQIRADHRSSMMGGSQGWKNQLLDIESRFKIARKTTMVFKYQDNSAQILSLGSELFKQGNTSRKYQLSGNTGFKLSKVQINSQFSASYQNFEFFINSPVNSNNLMFNFYNTLKIGNQSFNASLFINDDKSSIPLIGDLLNSDVDWMYNLNKKISLSSGFTYLDNKNMAKQIGIKQTIQFIGIKNIDLNLFFDARKNLITPISPFLHGASRGEISFTYHLNNK